LINPISKKVGRKLSMMTLQVMPSHFYCSKWILRSLPVTWVPGQDP